MHLNTKLDKCTVHTAYQISQTPFKPYQDLKNNELL